MKLRLCEPQRIVFSERAAASEVSLTLRSKGSFAEGGARSFSERKRGFTEQLAATACLK